MEVNITSDTTISIKQHPHTSERSIEEIRNELAVRLRDAGYTNVRLYYSGGGDSGQLDDILAVPNGIKMDSKLESDLSDFGDLCMEDSQINWYDGDGGGGTITFDLANKTFEIDVYYNVIESITGHYEAVDLFDGGENAANEQQAASTEEPA